MKTMLIVTAILTLISFTVAEDIIGKWQTKPSPKGNVTMVVFKNDNSFEGFINKKPFTSGKYSYQGDTLSFIDNGCNGKDAIYKVVLFSNNDSLRFEPIRDSCDERRNGMIKTILGRINN